MQEERREEGGEGGRRGLSLLEIGLRHLPAQPRRPELLRNPKCKAKCVKQKCHVSSRIGNGKQEGPLM